jgi:hypothetical protein
MARTPVLFIAGWGRSGSTILGNILGQLPGVFHVGELCHVWRRGIVENALCGCGVRLSDCPEWRGIFGKAFGGIDLALARRMIELRARMPMHKEILLQTFAPYASSTRDRAAQAEYVEILARLYSGIANAGANRIIVDSSKIPAYLHALGRVPELDLRVVHLVRDPRATTYSWLRRIERTDGGSELAMEQFPVWGSSGRWVTWNAMVPIIAKQIGAPTIRIHYESFVARPRETLEEVLTLVDDVGSISNDGWPFVGPNEVDLKPTHTVWGNPSRQRTGRIRIEADMEWSTELGTWHRALVAGLTYPLARKYGYFPARSARRRAPDTGGI